MGTAQGEFAAGNRDNRLAHGDDAAGDGLVTAGGGAALALVKSVDPATVAGAGEPVRYRLVGTELATKPTRTAVAPNRPWSRLSPKN
ncbi:hypothetical protein [Amycolatopsis sp. Hca4]|uniref:hypothetical protein n=1 Tax=Amycolatopsis sp. Hca4 TaxID=2742131 RepID=UPI001590BECA|nr:hypothetical protein [Amycolatopsis sp. Hca4]QKV74069.1 hypothetical protein HUT10_10010 [Amycolatopsis sp. Hca4]